MKRPDTDFLQIAKKNLKVMPKRHQKAYFDTVLSCPLLWFGDRSYNDLWDEWQVTDVPTVVDTHEWSFDEFVLCYRAATETKYVSDAHSIEIADKTRMEFTDVWVYVCTNPDKLSIQQKASMGMRPSIDKEIEGVRNTYSHFSEKHPNVFQFYPLPENRDDIPTDRTVYMRVHMLDKNLGFHRAFGGYYLMDKWDGHGDPSEAKYVHVPAYGSLVSMLEEHRYNIDLFNKSHQLARDLGECVLSLCIKLMTYMKYGEKHAVEKFPAKPKKTVGPLAEKRPWVNASGPHILLLDRLPSTQKPHQGGTHASPKPHRRRGHWKTLNHPRYRRHPQYQKKIFVKPSFVGPKQVTYEGNIYRLVDPLEDKL